MADAKDEDMEAIRSSCPDLPRLYQSTSDGRPLPRYSRRCYMLQHLLFPTWSTYIVGNNRCSLTAVSTPGGSVCFFINTLVFLKKT